MKNLYYFKNNQFFIKFQLLNFNSDNFGSFPMFFSHFGPGVELSGVPNGQQTKVL